MNSQHDDIRESETYFCIFNNNSIILISDILLKFLLKDLVYRLGDSQVFFFFSINMHNHGY